MGSTHPNSGLATALASESFIPELLVIVFKYHLVPKTILKLLFFTDIEKIFPYCFEETIRCQISHYTVSTKTDLPDSSTDSTLKPVFPSVLD